MAKPFKCLCGCTEKRINMTATNDEHLFGNQSTLRVVCSECGRPVG